MRRRRESLKRGISVTWPPLEEIEGEERRQEAGKASVQSLREKLLLLLTVDCRLGLTGPSPSGG